ncbi:MAG: hypothetical protein KGL39_18130 [Patescibacteria group bacterium]|nr:hypothetical protein [Patescibacteria group bacterium]
MTDARTRARELLAEHAGEGWLTALDVQPELLTALCDELDRAEAKVARLREAVRGERELAIKTAAELVRLTTPARVPDKHRERFGELVDRETVVDIALRLKDQAHETARVALEDA